ncbi:hypothetical protein N6G95_09620 [Pediococcus inopinatus]|uniref:hypothetical protein n=1 Tax=Pediococcus inopinatus TaxID=114090 RepID=UPI002B261992|nr:hypothetical protein [Pediococcus inopinatus]WPC19461.1 hypothetical protein N6G95_09620 [Pediococcus inopinatus]
MQQKYRAVKVGDLFYKDQIMALPDEYSMTPKISKARLFSMKTDPKKLVELAEQCHGVVCTVTMIVEENTMISHNPKTEGKGDQHVTRN